MVLKRRVVAKLRKTTVCWKQEAKETHRDRYDYSTSIYTGYNKKISIICKEHGRFEQAENNHRNGAGCPKCGAVARQDKRAHTWATFIDKALLVHGDKYTYIEKEIYNSRTEVSIICTDHGVFETKVCTHLAGQGCRACGYIKNGKRSMLGMEEFLDRAKEMHEGIYKYVGNYSGMHTNTRIECKKHGVFRQTPHNHLKGAGCPKCTKPVSKGELELRGFLKSLGVVVTANTREVIPPLEIDMYMPDQNLAVEYNGLWWHRKELVGDKTLNKYQLCVDKGITLVQVLEDEWANKREIVKARLSAMLGKSTRVFARKCAIYNPDIPNTRKFLEKHHIQGAGNTLKYSYALEHEGETVAMMTFSKGRFNNKGWEVLRYCSVGTVVGGQSRLLKRFIRDIQPTELVSYADLRWGSGNSYGKFGFTLDSITPPDYWWCKAKDRIPRYSMQSHKLGMPEAQYAKENGLFKVMGVGHKKWRLVL